MKVVHVQWQDPAFSENAWKQRSDFHSWVKEGIAKSDSVGMLVYEDDSYIVLAQSIGETQIAGGLKINRASIKRIKVLGQISAAMEGFS